MAEKKEEPASQSKSLTDSDSSDDNEVNVMTWKNSNLLQFLFTLFKCNYYF